MEVGAAIAGLGVTGSFEEVLASHCSRRTHADP
jgi:hypothetical protein